ncbi:MAG: protein-glutamate O-methyltransferase CheR, partial [Desulfoferrobacter sp.]
MRYPEIEKFLTKTIGLDSASIGPKSVERAVSARMRLVSIQAEAEYLAILQGSKAEQAALIESVVVPETWFFRDQGPFDYLREYVAREWKPSNKNRMFRVLSVPCSTGEEPFSIAITLIEAGLGHEDFSIDAVDISVRSLQAAKSGVYGKNSLREKDDQYVTRYFSRTEKGLQISERMLNSVRFQCGNILDPDFSAGRSPYDVVFCRNLLIYMTQEAKKRILDVLNSILLEGGLFFTGHTETMLIRSYGYSIVKHPRVFACRKA